MNLDTTSVLIVVLTGLMTCAGLLVVYSDVIQTFFLRRILYTATRLIMYVQDTGDVLYDMAWDKICDCLDELVQQSATKTMTIEMVFYQLFQKLNEHRQLTQEGSLDEQVIHRAIHIAGLWKTTLQSEIRRTKSIEQLKVNIHQFAKIIRDIRF